MFRAASRFAAVAAQIFFCVGAGNLFAQIAPRVAPTRPGENASVSAPPAPAPRLVVTRIGDVDCVDLDDALARTALKPQARDASRKVTYTDGKGANLVVEAESREVLAKGLRVFLGDKITAKKGRLYVSKSDYERCLLPFFRPALVEPPLAPPRVIAIDAGHGGTDNGMENSRLGLKEKELTLDVALRLRKLLEAGGYTVVMTRTDDRIFSAEKKKDLPHRALVANNAHADLFVSIHFNSLFPDTRTNGTEVYVYTRQNQRSDQGWAPGEEDDTRKEMMPVNRYDAWSSVFAQELHREVGTQLKTSDRGHKTKHLLALQDLNCPAALIEAVFLSNDAEGRLAATPVYRQKIAEAIADGVRGYSAILESLRPKPKTGTRAAPGTSNRR